MSFWDEIHAKSLITEFYGDRKAERSGVPLINHIREGLAILKHLNADSDTKAAYCLHPIVQHDDDIGNNLYQLALFNSKIVAYVMEYRNVANRHLSDNVQHADWGALWTGKPIKLSPLKEVNMMLIADKVQNAADFEIYHKGTHPRSEELDLYFKTWHKALEINYEELRKVIKG